MKRVRITGIPKAAFGGLFGMPYASVLSVNPFGLIKSDTKDLDKNVNDSVKPIDREKANIEAEKGELLFKFDAGGMFKIKGKKHSQGGTPLKADSQDFIFSDNKDLAITKEEAKEFNLKLDKSKKNNTPAKTLEREIDIKAYNKFVEILKNPKSDKYAKATAQIMINKYQDKIGQVGFIQESKKNFSGGVPEFTEGTAPVNSQEVQDNIDKSEMYEYGGRVYALGGGADLPYYDDEGNRIIDPYPGGKTKKGRTMPNNQTNEYDGDLTSYIKYWRAKGLDINRNMPNKEVQSKVYDYLLENDPSEIAKMWKNGMTAHGAKLKGLKNKNGDVVINSDGTINQNALIDKSTGKYDLDVLRQMKEGYTDNIFGKRQLMPKFKVNVKTSKPVIEEQETPETLPSLTLKNTKNVPSIPFEGFNVGMNANELISIAAPYLGAASLPTYYDMLVQKHTPDIRLDRAGNKQEINDIEQANSLGAREAYANMDPKIAAYVAAMAQSNANKAITQSNVNVRGENRQIGNQESQINFEKDISDNDFNLGQIQQVYRNNILSDQRRNEMLLNGSHESLNNMNAIQRNLDSLNQNLTRSVLPHLTNAYYDKDGNYLGQGDIDESWSHRVAYSKQMSPLTINRNRVPVTTGFGSMNSVSGSENSSYQNTQRITEEVMRNGTLEDKLKLLAVMKGLNQPNTKGETPFEAMTKQLMNPYSTNQ